MWQKPLDRSSAVDQDRLLVKCFRYPGAANDPLPDGRFGRRTQKDALTAADVLQGAPLSDIEAWRQQQAESVYSRWEVTKQLCCEIPKLGCCGQHMFCSILRTSLSPCRHSCKRCQRLNEGAQERPPCSAGAFPTLQSVTADNAMFHHAAATSGGRWGAGRCREAAPLRLRHQPCRPRRPAAMAQEGFHRVVQHRLRGCTALRWRTAGVHATPWRRRQKTRPAAASTLSRRTVCTSAVTTPMRQVIFHVNCAAALFVACTEVQLQSIRSNI